MAVTKTFVNNLIGTSGSKQNIAGAGTYTSGAVDASTFIGLALQVVVTYGGSIPGSDPLFEVLASGDDTNYDTEAWTSAYMIRATSSTKQFTMSVPFIEGIKYFKVKVTNGATNAIDVWVGYTKVE